MSEVKIEMRTVPAGAGWSWIARGFGLFRKNPLNWIFLCLVLVMVFFGFTLLGFLGVLVLNLLYPVFLAGIMLGCRALEGGKPLSVSYLFGGFRDHAAALITVGGIALVGQVVISGIMISIGGEELSALAQASTESLGEAIEKMAQMDADTLARIQLSTLAAMAIYVPLMMAVWFAPMLVIFQGSETKPALKASFLACLKNMLPFLTYGLILLVLGLLAMLPFGLGLFLLVPTVFASIYESYVDIFGADPSRSLP